jgi:murein DD-endopeptidase MepM/ murein hydrolase activator NlpD
VLVSVLLVSCLLSPVAPDAGHIVAGFVAPPCQFCAGGHRGLDYEVVPGSPVTAAAPGTVSFAGLVAGTRYVVIDHGDGDRTTYGQLSAIAVAVGEVVGAGQRIGTSGATLFFGLRHGDEPVDPQPLLAVERHRPRLVPGDGGRPRPAATRPPTCAASVAGTNESRR